MSKSIMAGESVDQKQLMLQVQTGIVDVIRRQAAAGIDIIRAKEN